MNHGEAEEKYRRQQQNGCGPPEFFHNVLVFSTWPCDSGTIPLNTKIEKKELLSMPSCSGSATARTCIIL